jgi:hypothetical protein
MAKIIIKSLSQAVSAFCATADTLFNEGGTIIRDFLVSEGVDITSEKAIGAAITPLVAAHYNHPLIDAQRVRYGDKSFKDAEIGVGKTCVNRRGLIIKAVMGETHSQSDEAPEFEIPPAVRAAAKALAQAQAAFIAATKGYEHAGALRKQALAAVTK